MQCRAVTEQAEVRRRQIVFLADSVDYRDRRSRIAAQRETDMGHRQFPVPVPKEMVGHPAELVDPDRFVQQPGNRLQIEYFFLHMKCFSSFVTKTVISDIIFGW